MSISPIDILIIENEQEREKVASELEKNDESLKNLIRLNHPDISPTLFGISPTVFEVFS